MSRAIRPAQPAPRPAFAGTGGRPGRRATGQEASLSPGLIDGRDSQDHLAHEAADLLYHLFVLLASADVTPSAVYAVLERRHAPPAPAKAPSGP